MKTEISTTKAKQSKDNTQDLTIYPKAEFCHPYHRNHHKPPKDDKLWIHDYQPPSAQRLPKDQTAGIIDSNSTVTRSFSGKLQDLIVHFPVLNDSRRKPRR